jgi:hypothetical protein
MYGYLAASGLASGTGSLFAGVNVSGAGVGSGASRTACCRTARAGVLALCFFLLLGGMFLPLLRRDLAGIIYSCNIYHIFSEHGRLLCPGVGFFIGSADMLRGKVGVYLCGGDVGMSQQFLYRPQVGTATQHMGGKAVSQSVRCNIFVQSGGFGVTL